MSGTWKVDPDDLESIAIGAGILGTGGGGNPYIGKLTARRLLSKGHEIEVVPLEDLPDDLRLDPNARQADDNSRVAKQIAETLRVGPRQHAARGHRELGARQHHGRAGHGAG